MNVAAHPLEWIYGTTHADPPACVAPEAATAGLDDAAVPMLDRIERAMGALCAEAAGSPLQQMACEHLQAGGKRLRARLAFDAALLAGACEHDAVWWGAACELLHNATLIHDDLQDGDAVRRGQPALWARHGAAQAINAGDLLLMLPYAALAKMRAPAPAVAALSACISRRTVATACGQAIELDANARVDLSWSAYVDAAWGKTGQFFALPIEGALLCGGADAEEALHVAEAFAWVGVVFQIIDDVVDLYGLKGRGEPGADIKEGKLSSLVVQHLMLAPSDRDWLLSVLQAPRDATSASDVEAVRARFVESGALDATLEIIRRGRDFVSQHPHLHARPALRAMGLHVLDRSAQSIHQLLADRVSAELRELA